MGSYRVKGLNNYSLFTLELLHNLHLQIIMFMKVCTVKYLLLYRRYIGAERKVAELFVKIRA